MQKWLAVTAGEKIKLHLRKCSPSQIVFLKLGCGNIDVNSGTLTNWCIWSTTHLCCTFQAMTGNEDPQCRNSNCPDNSKCVVRNGIKKCDCLPGFRGEIRETPDKNRQHMSLRQKLTIENHSGWNKRSRNKLLLKKHSLAIDYMWTIIII